MVRHPIWLDPISVFFAGHLDAACQGGLDIPACKLRRSCLHWIRVICCAMVTHHWFQCLDTSQHLPLQIFTTDSSLRGYVLFSGIFFLDYGKLFAMYDYAQFEGKCWNFKFTVFTHFVFTHYFHSIRYINSGSLPCTPCNCRPVTNCNTIRWWTISKSHICNWG